MRTSLRLSLACLALAGCHQPSEGTSANSLTCPAGRQVRGKAGEIPTQPEVGGGSRQKLAKLAINEQWCENSAGVRDGPTKVVAANGKLVLEGAYVQGKKDGTWSTYEPRTGIKTYDAPYIKGVASGEFVGYYPSGKVSFRAQQVSGQLEGPYISFYENGQKASSVLYARGDMAGTMTIWHENGQKKAEGESGPNGRRGRWSEWDDQGQLTRTLAYADGGGAPACVGPGCASAPASIEPESVFALEAAARAGVASKPDGVRVVPRALATRLLAAPALWLAPTSPVPLSIDGKPYGLKILQVGAGSVAETLGLAAGDVVIAIAGKPATSVASLATLLPELTAAKAIKVSLVHNGQPAELAYRID